MPTSDPCNRERPRRAAETSAAGKSTAGKPAVGKSAAGKPAAAIVAGGLAALLLVLFAAAPARAAGLLIADGGLGGVLEIKEHDVRVTVNNNIAVTHVTQVFQNTENRQVEALYTFPVPKGGSVANFSMWINGKEMTGEVVEKERAREIYNSYKRVNRDPGLLEQTDFRTFEMRIFPIPPRAEQRVQVTYYQELDVDHDWATYVYPLSTVTRPGVDAKTTGRFALNVDVKSAVPVVAMESPSHPKEFAVAAHDPSYYQASLERKTGDLSRDVVLSYQLSRPKTGVDMITSRQSGDGEDGYFALTVTAGQELKPKDAGMDYVFLLDVSGSMGQDGKLDLSRNSLAAFVNTLGPEDRLEVMAFNVQPVTLFNKLSAASAENKKRAAEFLESQAARGGTVLNPAMSAAYRYAAERPLNVLVVSDGMTEQSGRRELMRLIGERPKGARVFCIGVGNDVDRGLLQGLADEAGGLAAFLSKEDNLARQAAGFKRKLMHPVATDLKIEFAGKGVEAYDLEPRKLPNLYHGMPVRLYGRYKGDGPVRVTVSASVEGHGVRQGVDLAFPRLDAKNPEIERMWAWHKVDRLLNQDRNTDSKGAVDEIIRLGEGYSIATEYTSFIVLENDAEYRRWKVDRRNVLRVERDRAAQAAVAGDLEAMRRKAASEIGPVAAADKAAGSPVAPAAAAPNGAAPNGGAPADAARNAPRNTNNGNSRDFNLPRGGGGAIDPVSGAIALVLAGAAAAAGAGTARRRSQGGRQAGPDAPHGPKVDA